MTIKVKVRCGGGSGGGAERTGSAAAQINSITSKVQTDLLQQAKKNRRTGVTLPGYGS